MNTPQIIQALSEAQPVSVNGYTIRALPDGGGAFYTTDDPAELPALVYPHYCSLCNTINGGDTDGEGPCEHKEAVKQAQAFALARAERIAPDVDARREAFYQAGLMPPSPVYY